MTPADYYPFTMLVVGLLGVVFVAIGTAIALSLHRIAAALEAANQLKRQEVANQPPDWWLALARAVAPTGPSAFT